MSKESIILVGGLGTRLKSVVNDVPKPMADINAKPFLEYIFMYLSKYGIQKVVLAVGYKSNIIRNYFGSSFNGLEIEYSVEKELLGTGGAIKQALDFTKNNDVLVLNGDTFFDVNIDEFYNFHKSKNSKISIALKHKKNIERYGIIELNVDNLITKFREKSFYKEGFINGGVYLIKKDFVNELNLPKRFSFETDLLEKFYKIYPFYGLPFDSYFIDIGIPEDYERTKIDFKEFEIR